MHQRKLVFAVKGHKLIIIAMLLVNEAGSMG
jgi:hypothetical protein